MSVQKPTDDDRAGMEWWNSLQESTRRLWLEKAESARPVDAWRAYKRDKELSDTLLDFYHQQYGR